MKAIKYNAIQLLVIIATISISLNASGQTDYFEMAKDALKKKDYGTCISYCKQIVTTDPANFNAWWTMATAYIEQQKFQDASDCYSNAIRYTDASDKVRTALLYFYRATCKNELMDADGAIQDYTNSINTSFCEETPSCYYNRGLVYQLQKRDLLKARNDYQAAAGLYTNDRKTLGTIYANISLCAYELSDIDGAKENAEKCLQADPENTTGYYAKGMAVAFKGNYDEAAKSFAKAISLASAEEKTLLAQCYYQLGTCQTNLNDNDAALESLKTAIRYDPKLGEAYWQSSNIYFIKGDYTNAIAQINQAIPFYMNDDNGMSGLLQKRGNTWFSLASYDKAVADLKRAAALATTDPARSSINYDLGFALAYSGKITEAMIIINRSISADKPEIQRLGGKALMYGIQGAFADCIPIYSKMISMTDTISAEYYYRRAYCKFRTGDLAGAKTDAMIALDHISQMIPAYKATVLLLTGDKTAAVSVMNDIIAKDPEDQKGGDIYNLACIYALMKNKPQALKYLDLCLQHKYAETAWIQLDMDMQLLQGTPEFNALLAKYKIPVIKRE